MRQLAAIAALSFCAISFAQQGATVQPYKVELGPRPSIINTASFSPQVRNISGQTQRDVRNEFEVPRPGRGEPNTLPLGGMSTLQTILGANRASFPGINATGWVPPDPDIAVGPTHLVNVVNVAVAFFKKDGTVVFQQDLGLNGFFQGVATNAFVFDPKCFYDPIAKRFFIVALELGEAVGESFLLIAVSDDTNPEGNWFRYRIDSKQTVGMNSFWLDYPGFGFSNDAILITGNMFGLPGSAVGFNGIQFIVLNKAPLLTGGQPTISKFSQGGGSVQVMRTANDPNANVLYAANFASDTGFKLWAVRNGATSPTLTSTVVTVPTITWANRNAISVAGHQLDVLDGRMMNVYYRSGKVYAAHTIQASNSDDRPVSRWYDINLNAWPNSGNQPNLLQSGNIGTPGQDFWMPAIAANNRGDIAVIMSRCSSTIVADLMVSARFVSDPFNVMRSPVRLATSTGSQYGGPNNRWGDYFGIATDPVDDRTFWGVGMVANANGGWITRLEKFLLATPFGIEPDGVSMFEGRSASGTVTQAKRSDNSYYSVVSTFLSRTGQVASAIGTFTLLGPTLDLTANFEAKAVTNVTGSIFLWNYTTSKWVYYGSTPLNSVDATKSVLVGSSFGQYIDANRKVKVMVRAIMPERVGGTTPTFTLRIDKIGIAGSQ